MKEYMVVISYSGNPVALFFDLEWNVWEFRQTLNVPSQVYYWNHEAQKYLFMYE